MKKYPVTYKGKEYEVRWEYGIYTYLVIYEVKTINLLTKNLRTNSNRICVTTVDCCLVYHRVFAFPLYLTQAFFKSSL